MCRDAPRPDTTCTPRSARLVKGAALTCAAGAEPRTGPPVLHGRDEHGEHPPFGPPEHRGTALEFWSDGVIRLRFSRVLQLWGAERVNSSLPLVSDIPHNARLAGEPGIAAAVPCRAQQVRSAPIPRP